MDLIIFIYLVIILFVSIGLHEYAHAWTTYYFGDPTPKIQGRLTPNPIAHIDLVGFLMIFLINFGWGKPVQINPSYYRNPLRDELIVALAGPFVNLIMAIFGIIIITIYIKYISSLGGLVITFWEYFSIINIGLAIFNLIPIPPLDGFRIVKFLNPSLGLSIERYSFHISIVFIFVVIISNNTGLNIIGGPIRFITENIYNFLLILINLII